MAGPPYSDTAVILEQLGGGGESGDLSRSDGTQGLRNSQKSYFKKFSILFYAGVGGKLDDSIDHFFNPNFAQLNAWYGNFAGDPNIPVPHNSNNNNNHSSSSSSSNNNNNNNRNNSSNNNKSRQRSTTSQTTTPPQTTFSNSVGFEKQGTTRDFLRVLIS